MTAERPPSGARSPFAWAPNVLTLARVALAPAILAALVIPALDSPVPLLLTDRTAPAAGLIALAAALDWLDGQLARALRAESAFGRFWDPVADKLVVAAALIGGAVVLPSLLFLPPAALILLRDGIVTWLRTRRVRADAVAEPSALAKWKTALEYLALITLFSAALIGHGVAGVLGPQIGPAIGDEVRTVLDFAGLGALWLAALLSLWTGWHYVRQALGD
jgi:CDP-diacylglycerol--glycerol-3-phosphate 3-phosphatidyltransferase